MLCEVCVALVRLKIPLTSEARRLFVCRCPVSVLVPAAVNATAKAAAASA